jgi:hypothetical protein
VGGQREQEQPARAGETENGTGRGRLPGAEIRSEHFEVLLGSGFAR